MHKFTPEEAYKGGKTQSIYKSLANSLKKRKKCNSGCFYFEDCPLMPLSQSSEDKKCMMKAFPESTRNRFKDVFLRGEEGMIDDIKKAIYQYGLTATDLRGKKEYIELMLKLHKAIYGDKSQVITNNEPLQININQLQSVGKPEKEIPDGTIKGVVEVLESKKSKELRESLDQETDPESLFTSPMLPELMRPKVMSNAESNFRENKGT
jgi:hypothetical protein